jgi:hypothetical protein
MTRTYDIHTLRIGFVMVLFVDAHPITTLKGIDMDALTTIGRAWVDAAAQSPNQLGRHRHTAVRDYDQPKWDGIERRVNVLPRISD